MTVSIECSPTVLIRLRVPQSISLSEVVRWTLVNRVPVIFNEIVIRYADLSSTGPTIVFTERNGDRFSRHGFHKDAQFWNDKSRPREIPYSSRARIGRSRFVILARPEDEVLLTVRFGLKRDHHSAR